MIEKPGELGLMGIPYAEKYGGGGADNLSYALAIEELTRVDSSVAITVAAHTSLGTYPIYAFGPTSRRTSSCRELCSGQALWSFGLTEPEAGSDAGQRPHDGASSRTASGASTAPSSSSPPPARTSRAA